MAKCTGMRCPMQVGYKVNECNHKDCPYRTEPITNADRIRAMSDEELVEFIKNIKVRAALCKAVKNNDAFEELCSAEWLKQPAEEEGHA